MPIAQKQATTAWPDGSTWVFQGTIAEDATAGTHICSLTVSPGVGNEMQVLYWRFVGGNATTLLTAFVDDGANRLGDMANAVSLTNAQIYNWPNVSQTVGNIVSATGPIIVSGAMRLVLNASTATVSVTQTFAVVCRLRSPKKPTATLNDTIGTSTNTVNTNAIFG